MIRFTSNAFAAEFTEPGRGMIEIVTKPGTAKFLGELSASFNDDALNARNALATRRTPVQTRGLSGWVSGPIVKNRWGFQLYGGHWMRDTENLVNATVLGRETLIAEPFVTTIATGTRTRSASLGTDYLIGKQHRLALSVDYQEERGANLGLGSALDLPERAFTRSGVTPSGNLALSSATKGGATHELRLEWSRPRNETQARSAQPTVLVLDAFNGGGNQRALFRNDVGPSGKFTGRTAFTRGRHRFKVGLDFEAQRSEQIDESEFGGSFVFGSDFERDGTGAMVQGSDGGRTSITPLENYRRTLIGLPGYGPSQLAIERGDPRLVFNRWWLATFAQGDWMASPRLTLSYGARHTLQDDVESAPDLAPRVAATWALDAKNRTRIRAGAGLFHQQIPTILVFNALRYDGRRQRFIVPHPVFAPAAVDSIAADNRQSTSTYRIRDDIRAPRIVMSSTTFEHGVRATTVSIGYVVQIGDRLLRMRNINVPLPGQTGRPQPAAGPILEYESTGRSTRHEMPVSWRGNLGKRIILRSHYTLAFRRSDTEGPSSAPADPYDLSTEFGPSDSDRRHRGLGSLSLSLPGSVELSGSTRFSSGRPFNITTGRDNNGDSLFTDRPSFATAANPAGLVTAMGVFNPNPLPGEAIVPRNYGRERREVSLDMYVSKRFKPGGSNGRAFTISVSSWNVLNTVNLSGATGVITSPTFGRLRRADDARRIDLAMKWNF